MRSFGYIAWISFTQNSSRSLIYNSIRFLVEGGHRAIIFGRIGGIKPHIMAEGLHFRVPWFEYPIIYDIRAKPRTMSSPTGSKDLQMVSESKIISKDLMEK